jgi:hypothetical protein
MGNLKVYGKLDHFSAAELPCGDLPLASLPSDVAGAVDRLRQSLQGVDPNDKQAVRTLVEDPDLAVDAQMDAALWEIAIDCRDRDQIKFRVTENCGRSDTTILLKHLDANLPKLPRVSSK